MPSLFVRKKNGRGSRSHGMKYTEEQKKTGEWVRKISADSHRGWRAFYHTSEWKRKRKAILKRDRNACQKCRQQGRYAKAVTVHHAKHLRAVPELALTDSNLISLCAKCHESMHPEKHKRKNAAVTRERW